MRKILLLAIGVIMIASSANANFIDFRDAAFMPALDSPSFNTTAKGFEITLTAEPAGLSKLWWDKEDGIGIQSPFPIGYEPDEIEGGEVLRLEFISPKPVMLKSIHITDLFSEWGYFEIGRIQVDTDKPIIVQGVQVIGSTNGELTVPVDMKANYILFSAPGLSFGGGENHEYSVGGVTVATVPISPTLLLLASGIVGIIGIRRKLNN